MASARDSEESLERLRAVVRANPRSTTFVALAHALSDAGKDDEAEDVCRQGLSQHPRLTTGQVALGRALCGRGRLREAQEVLIEAAKGSPEHGDAFRWLGEVILKRGDRERARSILEYAEELSPNEGVVAELLSKSGGRPLPRSARPKTDFEHTRVSNARPLAQRMHEDFPAGEGGNGEERATPIVDLRGRAGGGTGGEEDEGASGVGLGKLRSGRPAKPGRGRSRPSGDDGGLGTPAPGPGAADAPGPRLLGARPAVWLARWRALHPGVRFGAPAGLAVVVLAVVLLVRGGDDPPVPDPTPGAAPAPAAGSAPAPSTFDFGAAIASGSLERLQAARAHGKQLAAGSSDGDRLAELAFVNALLASEHAQSTAADAEEAAAAAEKTPGSTPRRRALVDATRALLALAGGRLEDGKAAAERALSADRESAEAAFASGRVKHLTGDLEGAAKDFDAAAEERPRSPSLVLAGLERAVVALDAGDVPRATPELNSLLKAEPQLLRARLLRAEARRAAAEPSAAEDNLLKPCKADGRDTAVLRSQCAVDLAVESRLGGERGDALKAARNAVAGSRRQVYARGVAQGALALVSLGDIDGAADALRRIREESTLAFPPRALAELAVAAARGERVPELGPLDRARSPDGRLLAARLALSRGGPKELKSLLTGLPPGALEQDVDLRYLATLAEEGKLSGDPRKELLRRAEKGSSLAAYVLGRHELAAGNKRSAGKWLGQALKGHGDSCEAARLLLTLDARDRPSALRRSARVVQAVRGRNGGCVHAPK